MTLKRDMKLNPNNTMIETKTAEKPLSNTKLTEKQGIYISRMMIIFRDEKR